MAKSDIACYRRNLELKKTFSKLELDLAEVVDFSPLDLDHENQQLENLLVFVLKYGKCQSRQVMELLGFPLPPIHPGISPDSDWHRFELWMNGQKTRGKLRDRLQGQIILTKPEDVTAETAEAACEKVFLAFELMRIDLSMNDGIPPKLLYEYLYGELDETMEFNGEGVGWVHDGCTGYCPGCIQRPWCESGQEGCWPEDEEAGKMFLTPNLKDYVSAAPGSLQQLRANHQNFHEVDTYSLEGSDHARMPFSHRTGPPDMDEIPINPN